MKQRAFNLNPTGRTVYKVTHSAIEAPRTKFTLEPMRFIPHCGRAAFVLVSSKTREGHKVGDER